MNKTPLVSIIIPNFNGKQYLDTCLTSVLKTRYKHYEVLLVDDCSTDNSLLLVKQYAQKYKKINVLVNGKNIGAAASRNKAAVLAKGDILVFLDNDTEVDKNWLKEIVETLVKSKTIGACQAKLMDFKQRKNIQLAGVKLWAATGWGLPIGQGEKDRGQYDFEEDIIGISAALAVRKDVFVEIGGFDEQEAVVTEDLDLCWRIWLAGYRVVRSYKSIVYHWTKPIEMRKNMKHTSAVIYFHLTKNSLISIMKNYEMFNSIKYLLYSFVIGVGRSMFILAKRRDFSGIQGTEGAFFWFMVNFFPTLEKRKKIQKKRILNDQDLFDKVIVRRSFNEIYSKYYKDSNLL